MYRDCMGFFSKNARLVKEILCAKIITACLLISSIARSLSRSVVIGLLALVSSCLSWLPNLFLSRSHLARPTNTVGAERWLVASFPHNRQLPLQAALFLRVFLVAKERAARSLVDYSNFLEWTTRCKLQR